MLGWWIVKLWDLPGWVCLRLPLWPWILGQMEEMLWAFVFTMERGDLPVRGLVAQGSVYPREMHKSEHDV